MENETNYTPPTPNYPLIQQPLPNSTGVLVLGILSIALCWCYGLIGIILGIIALVLASKGNALYKLNPSQYSIGSYNNLKAGKICGIIGLSISALYLIIVIIYVVFIGFAVFNTPWEMYQ